MNKKNVGEFIQYLAVGGIATFIEWALFYLFNYVCSFHYYISTIIAYIISTLGNWGAGRIILFKKSNKGIFFEIGGIYIASIIGLLLNLVIMWVMIDYFNANSMISKIVATGLVFIWNYLIRKLLIYKEDTNRGRGCSDRASE